jgi:hypothetical protein
VTTQLLSPLTALVLLDIAGPASAHTSFNSGVPATGLLSTIIEPPASTPRTASGAFALSWSSLLLAILLLAARGRRVRRVTALALVLILSLFAFEAALHSTHHLTKTSQSTQCVIASTSGHVAGTIMETLALDNPLGLTPGALARPPQTDPAASPLRLNQARAPPLF